ncbi:uncharacterized protein LOC143075246 isoform X2 [Mytilus galloprovincialis]
MRLAFAVFCSELLATISIQISQIACAVLKQTAVETKVYWQRETNPVLFGYNVKLTCMVDRKKGCDKTVTRRWDLGSDRNTLLLNGYSINSSKYYEESNDPCDNFSLVIMHFDNNDVNEEYWCSFGVETSRQMLMLDDRYFMEKPKKKDIESNLEQNEERELDLRISFYKVYPKPKCKMKIGDNNWVDVTVLSNPIGIFFNSSLHYKTAFEKRQCNDNLAIVCRLLSYNILQLNTKINCTDTEKNSKTAKIITPVLIVVVFIFIGFVLYVCKGNITTMCVYCMSRTKTFINNDERESLNAA